MAALPYMQFYVADYLADTMHLTTEEHGAYLLLLMNYWQTGKPIPTNRLQAISRLPADRWAEAAQVLSEFFESDDEQWVHLRVESDLDNLRTSPRGKKLPNKDSLSGYKGYVYFVTSPSHPTVKIGYSKNPWARINELRRSYGEEMSVVATMKTVDKSEISVHKILSDWREDGEWFRKSPQILGLIEDISSKNVTSVAEVSNYVDTYGLNRRCTTATTREQNRTEQNRTDIQPPLPPKGGAAADESSDEFRLPTNLFESRGEEYSVPDRLITEYTRAYPDLDVSIELRRMRAHLLGVTLDRRRTIGELPRFISNWLQKRANDIQRNPAPSTEATTFDELRAVADEIYGSAT